MAIFGVTMFLKYESHSIRLLGERVKRDDIGVLLLLGVVGLY